MPSRDAEYVLIYVSAAFSLAHTGVLVYIFGALSRQDLPSCHSLYRASNCTSRTFAWG
jgi:hypothetical protein